MRGIPEVRGDLESIDLVLGRLRAGFTNGLWRMIERCWRQNWNSERPEVGGILRCLESVAQAWDTRLTLSRCATTRTDSEDSMFLSFLST